MIERFNELDDLAKILFGNISFDSLEQERNIRSIGVTTGKNEHKTTHSIYCAGTKKENIKIEVVEKNLIVSGVVEKPEEGLTYSGLLCESHFSDWSKKFFLDNTDDFENISANYEDGVLVITIPKLEKKKIEIKIK